MRDREVPEFPELPDRWQAIAADMVYRSIEGRLVSFSQTQGDRRFHAKIVEDVLHFPGRMTTH